MTCEKCRGRGTVDYGDGRTVPTDRCRRCGGTGEVPDGPERLAARLEADPRPCTPMSARVHVFVGERCLSLTADEAQILLHTRMLRRARAGWQVQDLDTAEAFVGRFRRLWADVPGLFQHAVRHALARRHDCPADCPRDLVRRYGLEERFLAEHPAAARAAAKRQDALLREARARYAEYGTMAELFRDALRREAHDHENCWDSLCPPEMVRALGLQELYEAWKHARRRAEPR